MPPEPGHSVFALAPLLTLISIAYWLGSFVVSVLYNLIIVSYLLIAILINAIFPGVRMFAHGGELARSRIIHGAPLGLHTRRGDERQPLLFLESHTAGPQASRAYGGSAALAEALRCRRGGMRYGIPNQRQRTAVARDTDFTHR